MPPEALPKPLENPKEVPKMPPSDYEMVSLTDTNVDVSREESMRNSISQEMQVSSPPIPLSAEERAAREREMAMHPLEFVPGYNDPDYRGISDAPRHVEEFEDQPVTLRSYQLVKDQDKEHTSGVRSKTPEELLIEEQQRKTG